MSADMKPNRFPNIGEHDPEMWGVDEGARLSPLPLARQPRPWPYGAGPRGLLGRRAKN